MAKINYQIGEGNFSVVLTRIAAILLIEFANQITLGNTFLPSEIYKDTDFSADEGNMPYVAVNWMDFDSKEDTRAASGNTCGYFIDVKSKGYDTTRKIIAIIRTILKSEQYIRLDLDYGIISETNILSAGVTFEEKLRDSQGIVSGGLKYQGLVYEINDKPVSTPLNESQYEQLINESDKKITLKQIY
jgi:hypothetical protein